MQQKRTVVTEVIIPAALAEVWDRISDIGLLRRACATVFGVGVIAKGSASPYDAASVSLLNAQIVPYDVLLTGDRSSIALRLVDAGTAGCKLLVAAAYDPEADFSPTFQQMDNFAQLMKSHCGTASAEQKRTYSAPERTSMPQPTPQPDPQQRCESVAAPALQRVPQPTPQSDPPQRRESVVAPAPQRGSQPQPQPGQPTRKSKSKPKKMRRTAPILVGALMVSAVVLGVLFWSDIRNLLVPYKAPTPGGDTIGYSAKVTLDNMLALNIGDTDKQVATALGTSGITGDQKNYIYFGGAAMNDGTYAIRINVEYENGTAKRITYLNLEQSRKIASLASANFSVAPEMTVAQMEDTLGVPCSMVRRYDAEEGEIREVHFGHTDPFGNFSPAWRGEFIATQNTTNTTLATVFWPAYDGADPMMIDNLEGHPVARQYSDYDQFLNDKYIFERSLYMLNRFSSGDARSIFGPMEMFSADGGVALYCLDSPEILDTSGLPAYRFSFGFDSRSQFVMSSFTNMRLFDRVGMLEESDVSAITRGMSYTEVREIMQILPTAMMVNEHYFSLCYGRRMDSEVFEDQFELIVSFDIDNNYVQAIYTNTGT